jgi:hypothetical protein
MAVWSILQPFCIFYGHLVYLMVIWYILQPFGIFYGHLIYFMVIWYILQPFGRSYGHLVYFTEIWYIFIVIWHIFPSLCMLYQEKSGNPGWHYAKKERNAS